MICSIADPNWKWALSGLGLIHIVGYIFVWTFVAFKPIIYVLTNDYFRKAFFDTYPCFKPKNYNAKVIDYCNQMSVKSVSESVPETSMHIDF